MEQSPPGLLNIPKTQTPFPPGRISSARTTEYVKDLLHRLEPYGDEPRVVELRERARPLLMAPA